jgi:hypothetical protein
VKKEFPLHLSRYHRNPTGLTHKFMSPNRFGYCERNFDNVDQEFFLEIVKELMMTSAVEEYPSLSWVIFENEYSPFLVDHIWLIVVVNVKVLLGVFIVA